jgi:hypothetical protein
VLSSTLRLGAKRQLDGIGEKVDTAQHALTRIDPNLDSSRPFWISSFHAVTGRANCRRAWQPKL